MTTRWLRQLAMITILISELTGCSATATPTTPSASAVPSNASATTEAPASVTASASPTPAAPPSLAVIWATFTSDRFAYSIDHASDWTVTKATSDWPDTGWPDPHGDSVDRFSAGGADGDQVTVSSDALAPGEVALGRRAEIDQETALACAISGLTTVKIDGATAQQEDEFCFGKDYVIDVFVEHGARIYLIDWFSKAEITGDDRALFDAMLARFRFGS
jgi:hypothetical protein